MTTDALATGGDRERRPKRGERCGGAAARIDIADELHERKMGELQGGQKVRVLLHRLFRKAPGMMLDEPTTILT